MTMDVVAFCMPCGRPASFSRRAMGQRIAEVHGARGEPLERLGALRVMVIKDGGVNVRRQVPAGEQARADLRMVEPEQLPFRGRHRPSEQAGVEDRLRVPGPGRPRP